MFEGLSFYRYPQSADLWLLGSLLAVVALALGWKIWAAAILNSPTPLVIVKPIIRVIALALLFIALLGPATGNMKKEVKSKGKDIMLVLDLSNSMNAQDIQPSRLQKIKYVLKELSTTFFADRIGLIIFSDQAFMQCPLTYDKNALGLFIESLNTRLVPSSGTEFAPALNMALSKLSDDDERPGEQTKIVVLISDGEDHGEESLEVAEELADKGIKLFTLGIGTEEGGPIPSARGYRKDQKGELIITKLNNQRLKELAEKAEGSYFEINDKKNETELLASAIDSIEGNQRDAMMLDVSANRFQPILLLALLLLGLDFLLPLRLFRV